MQLCPALLFVCVTVFVLSALVGLVVYSTRFATFRSSNTKLVMSNEILQQKQAMVKQAIEQFPRRFSGTDAVERDDSPAAPMRKCPDLPTIYEHVGDECPVAKRRFVTITTGSCDCGMSGDHIEEQHDDEKLRAEELVDHARDGDAPGAGGFRPDVGERPEEMVVETEEVRNRRDESRNAENSMKHGEETAHTPVSRAGSPEKQEPLRPSEDAPTSPGPRAASPVHQSTLPKTEKPSAPSNRDDHTETGSRDDEKPADGDRDTTESTAEGVGVEGLRYLMGDNRSAAQHTGKTADEKLAQDLLETSKQAEVPSRGEQVPEEPSTSDSQSALQAPGVMSEEPAAIEQPLANQAETSSEEPSTSDSQSALQAPGVMSEEPAAIEQPLANQAKTSSATNPDEPLTHADVNAKSVDTGTPSGPNPALGETHPEPMHPSKLKSTTDKTETTEGTSQSAPKSTGAVAMSETAPDNVETSTATEAGSLAKDVGTAAYSAPVHAEAVTPSVSDGDEPPTNAHTNPAGPPLEPGNFAGGEKPSAPDVTGQAPAQPVSGEGEQTALEPLEKAEQSLPDDQSKSRAKRSLKPGPAQSKQVQPKKKLWR